MIKRKNYHVKRSIYIPLALSKKGGNDEFEVVRDAPNKYHLHSECERYGAVEFAFRSYKKCMTIFLSCYVVLMISISSLCNYLLSSMELGLFASIVHSVMYSIFILLLSKHIISQIVLMSGQFKIKSKAKPKPKCFGFWATASISYAREFIKMGKDNAVLVRKDNKIHEMHYLQSKKRERFYGQNSAIRGNNISFAITSIALLVASIADVVLFFSSGGELAAGYKAIIMVLLAVTAVSLALLLWFLFHKSIIRYEEK